jgi:hypothetical protein
MKSRIFLLVIITLFCQIFLKAQEYKEATSLAQKLKGTWVWYNSADTFKIKILYNDTLVKSKVNSDSFKFVLYGWHTYIEKGKLIESNFQFAESEKRYNTSITGTIMNDEKIILLFHDLTRDRDFRVFIEFTDSSFAKIKWTSVFGFERPLYPPTKSKNREGQTIPSPIILKKISDQGG